MNGVSGSFTLIGISNRDLLAGIIPCGQATRWPWESSGNSSNDGADLSLFADNMLTTQASTFYLFLGCRCLHQAEEIEPVKRSPFDEVIA